MEVFQKFFHCQHNKRQGGIGGFVEILLDNAQISGRDFYMLVFVNPWIFKLFIITVHQTGLKSGNFVQEKIQCILMP